MKLLREISLGVTNFRFTLKKPCINDQKLPVNVSLSCTLSGNFLNAAETDRIVDTMNYEALCHHIETSLEPFSCTDSLRINHRLHSAILDFSDLITGGYVSLTWHCHDTFTINTVLAIPTPA